MNLLDKAGAVYEALIAATNSDKMEAAAVLQILNTMLGFDQAQDQIRQYEQQQRMVQPPPRHF